MSEEDRHRELRKLPSVERLWQEAQESGLGKQYGRELVIEALREALQDLRAEILLDMSCPSEDEILARAQRYLDSITSPTLVPVINATGVILHTNLGRAPLSDDVLAAMCRVGEGYSNLEFDLPSGHRGSRYVHAEELLRRLTGAEDALLVNNNAAAVLLVLSTLAKGRQVILSRGQLVEIGGGFRIPDVMVQSGAQLVEVGTTNRTYVRDYEAAITSETVALMRVHASNFRMTGFTEQPSLTELVHLAHSRGLRVFDDLGSGTLIDTAAYGLPHEPMVQESIAQGADLVTFSGDKLLGGPQAGIIVGKAELVAQLRHFALTRALRVDKTTIAGIQANLLHYVRGEVERIPIWRMMALTMEEIEERARTLLASLDARAARCQLLPGRSMIGGGSLPEESLPTMLIAIEHPQPNALAEALRAERPPIVTRVQDDRVVLDLRTVLPDQDKELLKLAKYLT